MKVQDYEKTINAIDSKTVDFLEALDGVDPKSEDCEKISANLKTLQETEKLAIECKNAHIAGKVPGWMTAIAGLIISTFFGVVVLREEKKGGVVSSQAINFFDKVSRKIG